MSIKKSFPTEIGVDATYWSVDPTVSTNFKTKSATIFVNGYASKEARKAGYGPMMTRGYEIKNIPAVEADPENGIEASEGTTTFDDFLSDQDATEIRPGVYEFLKSLPEFEGATDV